MEWLSDWLIGVTAAAILCALADRLMPEGSVRRVSKLAMALVQVEASSPLDVWEDYQARTAAQTQELEAERDQAMKRIIEQEFSAYIVDKAAQLGAACTAQVTCQAGENGVFLPQSAVVQGPLSPEQQETLARILEEELAIPRDRQTIQAEEGSP